MCVEAGEAVCVHLSLSRAVKRCMFVGLSWRGVHIHRTSPSLAQSMVYPHHLVDPNQSDTNNNLIIP